MPPSTRTDTTVVIAIIPLSTTVLWRMMSAVVL
eukprot:COSAG06_NODE_18326_length_893_cov_1.006297_1_plen_32_part_10